MTRVERSTRTRRGRLSRWRRLGIAILLGAAVAPRAAARAQSLPLPEKIRSPVVHPSPFDVQALVLEIHVTGQTRAMQRDMEGHEDRTSRGALQWYTYAKATVTRPVLVNERGPYDSDLAEGSLYVEQLGRGEHPLPLRLGRRYLVLLQSSPRFAWGRACSHAGCVIDLPFFRFSLPQGGFEIRNGQLRVLQRGGPLDAYDGRPLADVVKELQRPR